MCCCHSVCVSMRVRCWETSLLVRNLPLRCAPWQVEFRKTAEMVAAEPWALTAAAEYLQEWVQRNVDARWGAPPALRFVTAGPRDFTREGGEFSAWQDFAPTAARPVYVVRPKRQRKGPQAEQEPAAEQEAEPEVPHGLPGVPGGLAQQAAGADAGALYLGQNLESLLGILSQKPADRPDEFKGLTVGCSKCRRSERGCAQCRGLLARELLGQPVRRRRAAHQPGDAAAAPVPAAAVVRRRPAAAPAPEAAAPRPGADAPGPEVAAAAPSPGAADAVAPFAAEAAPQAVFHGDRGQHIFVED